MTIPLMPLPYAHDALEPHISSTTLETHHGAHHKTYVDKLNAAIEGTDEASKPLEEIVRSASGPKFNNSAQTWNHGFYWKSLSPAAQAPSGALAAAIDASFGSLGALKAELAAQGAAHFASGWVWLTVKDGKLAVEQTHDAATYSSLSGIPLLVLDVWEHAYYLDHKNVRPDYLKALTEGHLAWDFAAENFARGTAWTYPA